MADFVGKSFGRYHLVERLGEGGMAHVYKAYDTRLERYVAFKMILPEQQQNELFLKRFEREAKALAKLNHPNIVRVLDYGEQDGIPYLIMEYIPGGSLKQKTGRAMDWQEAAGALAQVARGLEYAHQHGILHRDIKPANLLLNDDGRWMISDFGIAKLLEGGETTQLTGMGVGIGTPEYMSPEQGQGHAVGPATDVYSLGIVFYELVTGRRPYQADTPIAVVLKHIQEPLPRPRQYVAHLPEEIEAVIFKALAKQAEERYPGMGAFAEALERLGRGTGEPTSSGQPVGAETLVSEALPATRASGPPVISPAPPPARPYGKRPVALLLSAGGVLVALALGILFLPRLISSLTSSTPPPAPSITSSPAFNEAPSQAPSPVQGPTPTLPSGAKAEGLIWTIDGEGDVGQVSDAVLGNDGLVLIAYYDATNGYLKTAHCRGYLCSEAGLYNVASDAGLSAPSIMTGPDGKGMISYLSRRQGSEGVVIDHCTETNCLMTVHNPLPQTQTISGVAISLGRDQPPTVLIALASDSGLSVAACKDPSCSSSQMYHLEDRASSWPAMVVGRDGLALISYYDPHSQDLKVAHCNDSSCSSADLVTLDEGGDVGKYSSIATGSDGVPVISYYDATNHALKLARCADATCRSAAVVVIDPAGGEFSSLAVGKDGLPIMSYYSRSDSTIRVAHCSSELCTKVDHLYLEQIADPGELTTTSLVIGWDGLPLITYWDPGLKDLKAARCTTEICSR